MPPRTPRLNYDTDSDPRWNGMTREQVAEMLAEIAFPDLVDVDDSTAPEDGWAPQWDATLGKYVPGPIASGGTFDGNHNDISGRSTADAHPMSAITGLVAALAAKADPTTVVSVTEDTELAAGVAVALADTTAGIVTVTLPADATHPVWVRHVTGANYLRGRELRGQPGRDGRPR